MPTSKQASKRLRQAVKRTELNLRKKRHISYLLRQAKSHIEAKDKDKAREFVLLFQKAVDKAGKTFMHKNKVARMKSRLMARFNTLK